MVVESQDDGPSWAAIAGIAFALGALVMGGFLALRRPKPSPVAEPAPAPAVEAPAPEVVTQLAPVAPVGSPDANGNYWPNQKEHEQEAREAAMRAKMERRARTGAGSGTVGGGTPIVDPADLQRRIDQLEREARERR